MGLKSWLISAGLLLSPTLFAGHYYKVASYPTLEEAQSVGHRADGNILDVGYYYPTAQDLEALKAAHLSKIVIHAGHFPDPQELEAVEAIRVPYELILDEVFPSKEEILRLNKSKIALLHILSKDFPTMGEVEAFNQFNIPVRFDILAMRLPRIEEMVVIRAFKPKMTVGFYNRMVPGPGHAGFFNGLNTKKVFVILDQFPWGIDPEGFNMLENAQLEIDPSERLMPQDVPVLNQFAVAPLVNLREVLPITQEWLGNVKAIKASSILVQDDGTGELLKTEYAATFGQGLSPVMFRFDSYH